MDIGIKNVLALLELWNDAPDGITYCVAEQNTMTRPYGLLLV